MLITIYMRNSFSVLILKTCAMEDESQNWICENDSTLKLASKSLYLSSGSTKSIFASVVDFVSLSERDFHWFAREFDDFMHVTSPCVMNKKRYVLSYCFMSLI